MAMNLIQAYRQAPWRVQMQWIGLFLLCLAVLVMVGGVYLSISAQAATAGLQIQDYEGQRESLQRDIADLRSQVAYQTSASQMESRAKELGFEQPDMDKVQYVVIPGYVPRQTIILVPPEAPTLAKKQILKPVYTQSLWEWMFQGALTLGDNTAGFFK
jgi:cell division protein FtsL